jgi:hypothetical protein
MVKVQCNDLSKYQMPGFLNFCLKMLFHTIHARKKTMNYNFHCIKDSFVVLSAQRSGKTNIDISYTKNIFHLNLIKLSYNSVE